jgi:hypothetical protein
MQVNEQMNEKVGEALKAHGLVKDDTETSSQYFIEAENMNGEESPLQQIGAALADFDLHDVYLDMDALSGFSNGWVFTVRQADHN